MSYLHASRSARLAMGAYSISIGLWMLPYQSVQAQPVLAEDAPLICFELPDYGAITFTDVEIMTTEQVAYEALAEHLGGAMNIDQGAAIYAQNSVFSMPFTTIAYNTLTIVGAYEYQLYSIGSQVADRVSVIFCPDL